MAPIETCDKHVYPATIKCRTNTFQPAPQKMYKSVDVKPSHRSLRNCTNNYTTAQIYKAFSFTFAMFVV